MIIKKVDKNFKDFDSLRRLYYSSFPKNERTPYKILKKAILFYEDFECFVIYYNNSFAGFCVLANHEKILHILFMAIVESLRGNGLGNKLLTYVCNSKNNNVILADLEAAKNQLDNRTRRINFYIKNGFKESVVKYNWNDENYVIYSKNGDITEREFWDFYKYITTRYNLPENYI